MSASTLIPNSTAASEKLSAAALRELICAETAEACASSLGIGLDAVILTGSMARDEASFTSDGQHTSVRGDAEFLLVFKPGARVPAVEIVNQIAASVEAKILQRGVACRICMSPVSTEFLKEMQPHIFAYELRECGRVVWGNPNVLSRIPAFAAKEIPLDDALRLLCNRMLELLELVAESGVDAKATQYATVKLYLDMATSFLVFAGDYRPSYQARMAAISILAANSHPGTSLPFPMAEFATKVERCTRIKLSASSEIDFDEAWFVESVRLAHLLWRWELQRLLGIESRGEEISDAELLARWAGLQPFTARLRGWLRVLRDADLAARRKNAIRWLGSARHQSPRLAVYSASSQLFFRVPELLQNPQDDSIQILGRQLPIRPEPMNGRSDWTKLAASIARNYHQFIEFTRT
jgi:hypothetical protein